MTLRRDRRAKKKKVFILGGGFGGVYSALELERRLGRESNIDVTPVNRDNFFLFTRMLHEVAASDLELTTIVNPVRRFLRKVQLFAGDVEQVDLGYVGRRWREFTRGRPITAITGSQNKTSGGYTA